MEAKELRIGNYVFGYSNEAHEIFDADDLQHSVSYNPIQITEEWLVKLGFEANKTGYRIKTSAGVQIIFESRTGVIYIGLARTAVSSFIEYVHQLQNLYFALTGEELTITK